jgi:hypothetical protein
MESQQADMFVRDIAKEVCWDIKAQMLGRRSSFIFGHGACGKVGTSSMARESVAHCCLLNHTNCSDYQLIS